jgi:hypothetical protein
MRRAPRRRHFARFFLASLASALALPGYAGAQTILNVERLQPTSVHGWHFGVEGAVDVARGNSDHTNIGGGLATGYRFEGDWLRLFAGLDYKDEQGSLDNAQYLHVRYNHWWLPRVQSFHFVQAQASHAGFLRDRYLVGSGVRLRMAGGERTTFDAGTGAMFEYEGLDAASLVDDHAAVERVVRMANLFVLNRRLSPAVRFVGVGYVQPRLDDFGDMRTLADLSVYIRLTESVDLAIRYQWRHDTRAPAGRRPDDVTFRSGLAVTFR